MQKTENNLYQRIIRVYEKVKSVVKDGEIIQGNGSYAVVTHDAVTKALHGPLSEAGIVFVPDMISCETSEFEKTKVWNGQEQKTTWYKASVKVSVTLVNSDKPEEKLTTYGFAYAFDTGDKAIGKAYSMAIKNIMLKLFMLESADQEEERIETGHKQVPIQSKPAPPKNYAPQYKTEASTVGYGKV